MNDHTDPDLEGVFQGEVQPLLERLTGRTDFKPWHKPRKHYIRLEQWCRETERLLRELQIPSGGELRYLGLPGEDFLDIRVLEGVCRKLDLSLAYLGFNSALRSPAVNLSQSEVNSSNFIAPRSVVISDRIEEIAKDSSIAQRYTLHFAPYDVVNLDLCDSVVSGMEPGGIHTLEAVRKICDIQLLERGKPWLFFLTTRTIRDPLPLDVKKRLLGRVLENLDNEAAFSAELERVLRIEERAVKFETNTKAALDDKSWFYIYVLSVAKWLLHYMMRNDYAIKVELLPSYGYSVVGGMLDMASIAFRLEPIRQERVDHSGLTANQASAPCSVSEAELAIAFVERVAQIVDLDDELTDRELYQKWFEKSARLMNLLHFDIGAYAEYCSVSV